MGDDPAREVAALRLGIELGLTLIDTAEMYADGRAEAVVAEASRGRREDVYLVSKVHPDHASTAGTVSACEASLRRLGTETIDLYLLHWRRETPLEDTVAGFERLRADGKIGAWGVSNFAVADLDDLPAGSVPSADQVLYNLRRRGPEADLIPRCAEDDICVMAYSPVEKGALVEHPALVRIASERNATPAQVALAWTVRDGRTVAVPKASARSHVRENAAALELVLSGEELAALDAAFPAPGLVPLETLS
jgi:diketogulonate reductase-like aldo/keto reductase